MLYLVKKCLRILIKYSIICLISSIIGDFTIITPAYADSEDEEKDEAKTPKRWKGKGKAIYNESDDPLESQKLDKDLDEVDLNKQEQEAYDFELAKYLQDEEFALAESKFEEGNKSETESEYSVYSSEIHDSDTDSVKEKKLEVKEKEKSLKRKYSDVSNTEQSSRKK